MIIIVVVTVVVIAIMGVFEIIVMVSEVVNSNSIRVTVIAIIIATEE